MNARADLIDGMLNGLPDDEASARIDAHQSEVLRKAADIFESACPDGPGPLRFELCQCAAAGELRIMATHPELFPNAGGPRG